MKTTTVKTIEIVVSPAGETKVETKGFRGGECLEASRFLETAIGKQTAQRTTAEFFATSENSVRQQERQ